MIDVVLPVLDEAAAIPWVLSRMPPGYRAIVVDNGSADGSAEVAAAAGAVVVHEQRRGFGAACFTGLRTATAETVCFMDCDGSLDPRDLPTVADPVADATADLVLGTRRATGDALAVHVRLANRYLAWAVGRRSGARLSDIGPMRAGRRAALLDLGLTDRRSGWPLEMVLRAAAAGWRIGERPVPYYPRTGRSKVTGTLRGTVQAVLDMRRQLVQVEQTVWKGNA
ncbi:glycosyltransferase involved in cell wall biosynthesis [Haloactinopolyspora alba]|uniref:Glycosyltransferase involved in cell wall biosynthesis n=1 Tax=Haloactinopolyspora alba TaxID=648780 RepID=A0A2P8DK79_9ACTN|nr:glycosyltransferase family 2 protein [Haloactinopolyspora alba]PSK97581.1 glycosyltransferase involved in cell wall biosynthesis [Haloactinopolyspora alba]